MLIVGNITLVVPDIFLTSPASTASLGIGDLESPSNAATPSHGQAQVRWCASDRSQTRSHHVLAPQM